jgi:hypothetical protein
MIKLIAILSILIAMSQVNVYNLIRITYTTACAKHSNFGWFKCLDYAKEYTKDVEEMVELIK